MTVSTHSQPAAFLGQVWPTLARLRIGDVPRGNGFLAGNGVIATNRHLIIDPATGQVPPPNAIHLTIGPQTAQVSSIQLPDNAHDIALLALTDPIPAHLWVPEIASELAMAVWVEVVLPPIGLGSWTA